MNYRFILILILLTSCATYDAENKQKIMTFEKTFSNAGFAIVYDESLKNNNIISKKLDERSMLIFQKSLKKNTFVKVTNVLNNKSVIAQVSLKSNYPIFYNSVISKRIAEEIELDVNEPYILIKEINKNSTFIAKKAKTFDEEKKVANKAPVDGITINTIGIENKKKNTNKTNSTFSYIIKIADFYFLKSAKELQNRIKSELNVKDSKIYEINKNLYRLYVGPFNNLISLKTAYNDISKLEFENIEMIKQ